MRRTTASPAFVGSPTRVATWTPFGNAGLSFHITASGVTWVCLSCAIPELANAIKAAATKSCFFMLLTPCQTFGQPYQHPQSRSLRLFDGGSLYKIAHSGRYRVSSLSDRVRLAGPRRGL